MASMTAFQAVGVSSNLTRDSKKWKIGGDGLTQPFAKRPVVGLASSNLASSAIWKVMLTGKQLVLKTSGPSGLLGSSPRLSAKMP